MEEYFVKIIVKAEDREQAKRKIYKKINNLKKIGNELELYDIHSEHECTIEC